MYSRADGIINLFTFFHNLPSSHFQGDMITLAKVCTYDRIILNWIPEA